jgi:hypothetical protein
MLSDPLLCFPHFLSTLPNSESVLCLTCYCLCTVMYDDASCCLLRAIMDLASRCLFTQDLTLTRADVHLTLTIVDVHLTLTRADVHLTLTIVDVHQLRQVTGCLQSEMCSFSAAYHLYLLLCSSFSLCSLPYSVSCLLWPLSLTLSLGLVFLSLSWPLCPSLLNISLSLPLPFYLSVFLPLSQALSLQLSGSASRARRYRPRPHEPLDQRPLLLCYYTLLINMMVLAVACKQRSDLHQPTHHPMPALLFKLPFAGCIQVTSDGLSSRPHVSWLGQCSWTSTNQALAATALCTVGGYNSGTYVSASNDPCSSSFTSGDYYYFTLNSGLASGTVSGPGSLGAEAQITATCCSSTGNSAHSSANCAK